MRVLEIYTDGSYRAKSGKGAYGFVVMEAGKKIDEYVEAETDTTNNKMEMKAVGAACEYVTQGKLYETYSEIKIYCDSEYVVNGLTKWWPAWEAKDFITAGGKDVKNLELWKALNSAFRATKSTSLHWVRGHHTTEANNAIDKLVQSKTKDP